MKTNYRIMLVLFALLAFAAVSFTACNNRFGQDIAADCIRIHIRANSNDDKDQTIKLAVRDRVTEYLTARLSGCKDKSDAIRLLNGEIDVLNNIADNTLKENGYAYKSCVRISNEHFPQREYDGYIFPAGDYDALIIELGSGEGNNWWCVAFPPLCFVPDGGNGEKIVYKSWVKEKLDSLFGKR